jgi:hypothetical protein
LPRRVSSPGCATSHRPPELSLSLSPASPLPTS